MDSKNDKKITEVEVESFDELYESIESNLGGDDDVVVEPPDSRLSARKWILAYQHLEDEIEYYKKEYIPSLEEKYIKPVKKEIEKHERQMGFIKSKLVEFLDNVGETTVKFPDLATMSKTTTADKIIYPKNEKELAETLHKNGETDFVRVSYALDKKAIGDHFKKNKKVPISDTSIEEGESTVRFTRKNKKSE